MPRSNGLRDKGRTTPLPSYSNTVHEKHTLRSKPSSWTTTYHVQLPWPRRGVPRRIKFVLPLPPNVYQSATQRLGRRRTLPLFLGTFLAVVWTLFALGRHFGTPQNQWPLPFQGDPPTLVYAREDLRRVWEWEIASGHYPSSRKSAPMVSFSLKWNALLILAVPEEISLAVPPVNPAIARKQQPILPSRFRPPSSILSSTVGAGPKRTYLDVRSAPPAVAYPPRPVPGSVADLDVIMDHCDFSKNKVRAACHRSSLDLVIEIAWCEQYVRDCLEVLRLGGGLDNGKRVRRGKMDDWKYIYMEEDRRLDQYPPISVPQPKGPYNARLQDDADTGLVFRRRETIEPHLRLPPPRTYRPYVELSEPCDSDYPRIFHMFWTGLFTDKPYLALLSFLFTQNLGLHLPPDTPFPKVCRPQFWLWINPGPAAAVPNPTALRDMFDSLKANPWSAPFLHPRFKDVIKFKLWNTTEQLDGVPELKDEWRSFNLFNSGGHVINVPKHKNSKASQSETEQPLGSLANGTSPPEPSATNLPLEKEDDMFGRTGSTSSSSYDRLSVILSDMARFILCHRFGGTYLDADTIFLRDWEELWGWKGAFAYRWSRLEKYNTAVLRMNQNSALGTFLFRTALRNELDFHPMTISRYTKDAYLEGLLLRLPDALFDSAWLNTEYYQRDRPPFPYFTEYVVVFIGAARSFGLYRRVIPVALPISLTRRR